MHRFLIADEVRSAVLRVRLQFVEINSDATSMWIDEEMNRQMNKFEPSKVFEHSNIRDKHVYIDASLKAPLQSIEIMLNERIVFPKSINQHKYKWYNTREGCQSRQRYKPKPMKADHH